jgi:hypothetical protein
VYGGEGEEGDCGVEPASRGYLNPGSPPPRLHQAGQPGTAQVVGGGGLLHLRSLYGDDLLPAAAACSGRSAVASIYLGGNIWGIPTNCI